MDVCMRGWGGVVLWTLCTRRHVKGVSGLRSGQQGWGIIRLPPKSPFSARHSWKHCDLARCHGNWWKARVNLANILQTYCAMKKYHGISNKINSLPSSAYFRLDIAQTFPRYSKTSHGTCNCNETIVHFQCIRIAKKCTIITYFNSIYF